MFGKKKNKEGKEKKPFKETKIGAFANKVAKEIPSIALDVLEVATSPNPLAATLGVVKDRLEGADGNSQLSIKEKAAAEALLYEYKTKQLEFEAEVYELEVRDRESARNMYINSDHETADFISLRIIKFNLPIILALVVLNVLAVWLLEGKGEVIAIVSNFIGIAIGHLFNERQSIINFFFGSSQGSKDKGKKLGE